MFEAMSARLRNLSVSARRTTTSNDDNHNANSQPVNSVANSGRRRQAPPRPPQPLSDFSSPVTPNSGFASMNVMLGAGMVVFQPSTHRIVVVQDTRRKDWFLPRGRKDVGEELGRTALREAHEETGYDVELLPLIAVHHQPDAPGSASNVLCCEPIYITLQSFGSRHTPQGFAVSGGEYVVSWYAGQITHDAVPQAGTGMPDEQSYQSHLVRYQDALRILPPSEATVVRFAWALYANTHQYHLRLDEERHMVRRENDGLSSVADTHEDAQDR